MNNTHTVSNLDDEWNDLRPHIDAALGGLSGDQRDAILLRYFYGFSQSDAAQRMNCSQATLSMRVTRGMARLRERLRKRGVLIAGAAVPAVIAQHGISAAPSGLSAAIAAQCLGKTTASASAAKIAHSVIRTARWLKYKLALSAVALTGVTFLAAYWCRPACTVFYADALVQGGGDGSEARPWNLAEALAHAEALKPGCTLLLKPGEYHEMLLNALPGGTDWQHAVTVRAADPLNRPVLKPLSGKRVVEFGHGYRGQIAHHICIESLVIDGSNISYECVKITDGAHDIRIRNCEIRKSPLSGVLEKLSPGNNEYIHDEVHDNGRSDGDHGISLGGSNDIVEGCDVHENAGWGIQIYDDVNPCNGTVVRGNRVFNNARAGKRGAGIGLYSGRGHVAVNNLVWNNPVGISVDYAAADAHIFFNTVCKNRDCGILIGAHGGNGNQVCNNILFLNKSCGIRSYSSSAVLVSGNVLHGNRAASGTSGADADIDDVHGTAVIAENRTDEDPLFTDASHDDFHLKPGSCAIGAARIATGVTRDCDGHVRPAQNACAGAYEYTMK